MLTYILLILGFVFVIKGADYLVEGASSLAKHFKISDLVIGLTVVSFGTSAPELVVNLIASFNNSADIAIGNVLGSNIANILLILGVASIIYPLQVTRGTVWKEIPLSLLAAILIGFMANDMLIDGAASSALSRIDGLVLLAFFTIFMYYVFSIAKQVKGGAENIPVYEEGMAKSFVLVLLGMTGLVLGGRWVVTSAVEIATALGVSAALVGLTIVALGTSLPELATSAVAAYKKNADIAVGNVVGSNIFNIFWILGLSATIKPLPFAPAANFDILITIAASLLLFIFLFLGRRHLLERWQGVFFLLIYVSYIGYLIARG